MRPYLLLVPALALAACSDGFTPADGPRPGERRAELIAARIPAAVDPLLPFDVVAVYGRGVCDRRRPLSEREGGALRVGLRLTFEPLPPNTACPDLLVHDTVTVRVQPPYPLPFTVRLERGDLGTHLARADTVFLVRGR